jgi:uncharacterized protein (TIGR02646 family)
MVRRIKKGTPPACLDKLARDAQRIERETGKTPLPEDWSPGTCAQPTRDALFRDQCGLCGYCLQQIGKHGHRDHPSPTGNGGMRIEHVVARRHEPHQMYAWSNLLGVCGGRSGAPGGEAHDHCDRSRGDRTLALNPNASPLVETALWFSRQALDGSEDDGLWVRSAAEYQNDITILELNNPALRRRRRDAERVVAEELSRLQRRGKSPIAYLQRLLLTATTPDSEGRLPSFAPVVRQYAERKLRNHGL